MFRDEPFIRIYIEEVAANDQKLGNGENVNQNDDLGQDGNDENVNQNAGNDQNVGNNQNEGNDQNIGNGENVGNNENVVLEGDIVKSDESDESYVVDSDESTEDDSDFEYFLDGDTLNDSCGIDDDGVVNDEVAHNINLGEYAAYVELIRDDYASFQNSRKEGHVVENENIVDHDVLEIALNSSDDENKESFPEFNEEKDIANPQIEVGLVFSTVEVYRRALRMFSIKKGFELKFIKNDPDKVIAICIRNCGWRIHASFYRGTKAFQVKSIRGTPHRCPWSYNNRSASAKWLCNNFHKELADDPEWRLKGFRKTIRRRFKLHVSKWKIYRAKNQSIQSIQGEHRQQYCRLRDYCGTIMDKNPGSVAYVVSEMLTFSANPVFKRMFVMYGAQKYGFVQGCRPVIGLDACHLKGKFGGHLMHPVGRDGNNQMYPLAMAWVESECKDSWAWFLTSLTDQIGAPADHNWVFISDRQKGLVETFDELFPGVEHRFCVWHMYANFKLRFKDKALRDIMWAAARAYEPEIWRRKMRDLEMTDKDAYKWLSAIPPYLWTRCMFSPRSKCDLLCNNISESFNQYISTARDEPIYTMFETIRRLIMCRYQEKRELISKIKGNICPRIHDRLEEIKQRSFDYEAILSGNGIWEVTYYNKHFVVNLYGRSCTCKEWDLTGIPCEHACAAIMHNGKEVADYVHPFYTIELYKRTYKHVIIPIPEKHLWLETGEQPIEPSELRRRPGRPRKLRRKGPDEKVDSSVVTRRGTVLHCSNCKQAGHNRKTCKQPVNTRQTSKNVNEQDGGSNQSTVQSDITARRGIKTNIERGTGRGANGRGTNGRGARKVARGKGAGRGVSNNPSGWGRGNSSSLNGRDKSDSSSVNGRGKSASTNATARERGFSTSGARRGRGRGRSGPNPGPYSGIGNWNGIGMSSMNHFMPADQLVRMIMQQESSGRTVQMWGNNSQSQSQFTSNVQESGTST
ncbi:hypothetical protein ACH5RR_041193 [Cinchona calisaya]|uniref:SWIM-type domain-containing protein n=1 Tax=Cinchona calisaya TaxID=153742 RepID=A0ABD2XVG8_9GENT